ncbi:MAG: COX15/CtaA family protein [Rhodothalassiaceae bacterium]
MSTVTIHPGGAMSHLPVGSGSRRAIAAWLLLVAGLVLLMVVVGGVTRLTESGLSIVEWKPVSGILPPLSASAWDEAFRAYQQYPEYQLLNRGMTLAEFKSIYWWEYVHRLLGRLIGIAYALPLVLFWIRDRIPRGYKGRLLFILVLGALQGVLGWIMVRSGLVSEPEVSHYRLAAHLLLAVSIYALLIWTALDLVGARRRCRDPVLRRRMKLFLALVFVQIGLGGLVAGLKAGHVYGDWPWMNGRVFPELAWSMRPWWRNFVDNAALVQFEHRLVAYLLVLLAVAILMRSFLRRAPGPVRIGAVMLLFLVVAQATLGVITLYSGVALPIAVLHQAGALVVLAAALDLLHLHGREEKGA